MSAYYDSYDYPSYWEGREYEHRSEIIALSEMLAKIPKIKTILEIGAGYGRLLPFYGFRASKIVLTDPSAKLLKMAREIAGDNKTHYIQSRLENLPGKIRTHSINTCILIRVLHHIDDLDITFATVNKLLTKNGYLILEFANKRHLKAVITEYIHGNLTFSHDIFPKDILSKKRIKHRIPFRNYHPDLIMQKLYKYGFRIIDVRSVSNIRSPFLKKLLPLDFLLFVEKILQKPFSYPKLGPSIFILAKKVI